MGPAQWLNLSDCQSYKKRLAPIIIDFEHVTNFQDSQLIEQGERFTTYLFKGQSSQKLSWAAGPIVAPKSLEKMGVATPAICAVATISVRPDLASGFRGKSPDAPSVG